jgi:hypothetical protein
MDKGTLREHLAQAETHVTEGERHIAEQKARIADLTRDGHAHAAEQARELLAVLLDSQALHVRDRDRLRRELGLPAA